MSSRWRPAASRIKTPKLLDRGTYGWSERILERECSSKADVSRYFRRQGIHLAAVYLLRGQDFHAENFVAHGQPAGRRGSGRDRGAGPGRLRRRRAAQVSSALHLLGGDRHAAAVGRGRRRAAALGHVGADGSAGRPFASRMPVWKDTGTDNLRLGRVSRSSRPCREPSAAERPARRRRAPRRRELDGFRRGYRAIARRKRTIARRPDWALAGAGEDARR